MSRLIGFVRKNVDTVFGFGIGRSTEWHEWNETTGLGRKREERERVVLGRNNELKKEVIKKNIQTKEADFGFTEVFFHNIPNEQVSDKMAKVIPK